MQDDIREIKVLAIVGVVGVFSTLLFAIVWCVLAKSQAQKAQSLLEESYLAYEKNQNSQILLLEQIVERVLELHGSAPAPHATEAPHRHAGVVESGDRISQGFEAKLIELDQKISLILRSLYLETPRDSLPSAPRGAHRLGSSPRKGPGLSIAALATSNRDDRNFNDQAQLQKENENRKHDLEALVPKLRAETDAPSKLQAVPKLNLVPHSSPATLEATGIGPSDGSIQVGNDSPRTIVQIPVGSNSSGMQTDMEAEFDNSDDEDGEVVHSQKSSRSVNFSHASHLPPSGAECTSSSLENSHATASTGLCSHGKEGTQPGILKAVKRRENASFISSIDERLATSHVLLYDVDRKVKDMVPVIGKLLAMNDDIAAVLLPAIVTALEKIILANDELKQSLPTMLAKLDWHRDDKVEKVLEESPREVMTTVTFENILEKREVMTTATLENILRVMQRENLHSIISHLEKYTSTLLSSSAFAPQLSRSYKPQPTSPPSPPLDADTKTGETNANKYLVQHRDLLSAEAQTVLSRRLGHSPPVTPQDGANQTGAVSDDGGLSRGASLADPNSIAAPFSRSPPLHTKQPTKG